MAKRTFEHALVRLEQLVTELEQGEADLDLSLKKFDEGVQLAGFCRQKLNEAKGRVELLLKKDGGPAAVPFGEDAEADRS